MHVGNDLIERRLQLLMRWSALVGGHRQRLEDTGSPTATIGMSESIACCTVVDELNQPTNSERPAHIASAHNASISSATAVMPSGTGENPDPSPSARRR